MSRVSRRTWFAFAACAAAMLGALAWITALVLGFERSQLQARAEVEHQATLRLALWRMDSWLAPQLAREAARPWFEYSAYSPAQVHGAVLNGGEAPTPSPLLTFRSDLFLLHFQSTGGALSSPQVPVPGQGEPPDVNHGVHAARLAALRERLGALASPLDQQVIAAEAQLPPVSCTTMPASNLTQVGNLDAAKLRTELEYQSRAFTANAAIQAAPPRPWMHQPADQAVSVGPLLPIWLDGAPPRLLFVRRVQAQGQRLLQGFVVDWQRLRDTLLDQVGDLLPAGAADLQPFASPEPPPPGMQGNLLATVPAALRLGPAPAPPEEWSAGRSALLLAWAAVLAAVLATAHTLRSTLVLGERRARFASAVTHELRTPLTTFRMYSEMLADDMLRDAGQRREYLETLRSESDRLARLVENVLCYARLEEGRYRGRRETATVGTLLARVAEVLQRRCAECGMALRVDVGEALAGEALVVDVEAVEQILFNLVDNACKYAPTPGTPLELRALACGDALELRLCDHGSGVPEAHRARIFQPFERGARATADSVTPGVGLGLALSRSLARDLGGDLRLDAAVTDGACFVLTIPRRAVSGG